MKCKRRECEECGNVVAEHPNGRLYRHKWIRTWHVAGYTGELQPWCPGDDEEDTDEDDET